MGVRLRLPLILSVVSVCFASKADSGSERPLKSRTFQLTYQATIRDIPRDAKTLEAWVPLPQTDPNQTIHQISINAPVPLTIGRESRFGNLSLHARVDGPKRPVQITLVIENSSGCGATCALGWPDPRACCRGDEGIDDR